MYLHFHTDGGGKVVRRLAGDELHRFSPVCKLFGKTISDRGIAHAGAQPVGNQFLVPAGQQAGGQGFPKIIMNALQIGSHKLGDGTVPGILPQQGFKTFYWFRTEDGIGLGGVLKLHIE